MKLVAPRRDLSAIRRIVVLASIVIAIVGGGRVAFLSTVVRQQTIDHAERELATASKITAEQLAQIFSAVDILTLSIQELASRPSLRDEAALRERATTAAFQNALVGWQTLLPQVEAASVVGVDGDILSTTRHDPLEPSNIADASIFQALKSDPGRGLAISGPILAPGTEHWLVFLGRSLKDDQGRFAGVVLASIPIDYLESYFSAVDVGTDTSVALSYADGTLISSWPRAGHAIGAILTSDHAPLRAPRTGETVIDTGIGLDHVRRVFAMTQILTSDTPLLIAVGLPKSVILESWRTTFFWSGGSAAIIFVVVLLLVRLLMGALRDEELTRDAAAEREAQLSRQAMELAAARDFAQAANRARGEFLANMSHELRTPLNAILGFSEILETELFGPLGDPRYKEFVADIHSGGRHLLDIISNILDLTKIDAGKLDLDECEVEVADLMRLCARLVRDAANQGKIRLELRLPLRRVVLWADPTRLKQILLNLLSNAIKFTPEGGAVVLSAYEMDKFYVFNVSDTGIGMSPGDLEDAMLPFRQIDSSLARRYQGTGLGLPLTQSLVDLHGGLLEIVSEVNQGTAVMVKLPRSRIISPGARAAGT